MRGIASETSTFLAFQQQETSKPRSMNFGADIYGSKKKVRLYFFPEATIEIPLYLWKQVFWFKNFVLPVPPRLVNGKLGQGILIYVSKASVVVRSIFIYPSSPKKKSVKSR